MFFALIILLTSVSALLEHNALKTKIIYTVVADVTSVNAAAFASCLKAGFQVALQRDRVLVKFGSLYNMTWFQRTMQPEPDLEKLRQQAIEDALAQQKSDLEEATEELSLEE